MALIRKRRLTEQQQRRIEKQHKSRQDDIDTSQDLDGLVVQHYGRQLEVQALSVPDQHPEKPEVQDGEPEPFWKQLNWIVFGVAILVPISNYWSLVIASNGKQIQIQV